MPDLARTTRNYVEFRRTFGLTPAAYRKCCTGVPDAPAGRAQSSVDKLRA